MGINDVELNDLTIELVNLFDRIGIQMPCNFHQILQYIYDRVPSDWDNADVAFLFKLWIESKTD